MIDGLYGNISNKNLHLVRFNQTSLLYSGNNSNNIPMANWAIDSIIEVLQTFYHQMKFSNNYQGWMMDERVPT